MEYRQELSKRVARQQAFFASRRPGDLLVHLWWDRGASLEAFLCTRFNENPPEKVLDPSGVPAMVKEYVALLRQSFANVTRYDDDVIPTALVYWGIGGINAAMTGLEPFHDAVTSWLEPSLSWDGIGRLAFDPDNKWVRFALHVNQALWNLWDGDFHVLPFLHRSPLDAANGIRGNELFAEMYTDPRRVHRLTDWCADWQIAIEKFLADNVRRPCPPGWGNAVWGTWLPDGGVFVNGDPVGLISRQMAIEFEQPYTAKLFTNTGGGFFHNHTIGLYQADLVSSTPGTLVQYFVDDPNQIPGAEALLDHPDLREKLLAASLDAPIGIMGIKPERLDELLDIARHGRFILALWPDVETPDADIAELIAKVRRAGNLG
ncbi:MAG TPA: hypothetical protein VM098_02225 [Phycisphaerae bacterium]|nr:hypothetical protein [Phycisphaerae bacterium]